MLTASLMKCTDLILRHTSNTTDLTIGLSVRARRPTLTQWVSFGCGVCRPLLAACDPAPRGEDRRCHCCCCCRLCCWIQAFIRTHSCRRAAPYWAAVIWKRRELLLITSTAALFNTPVLCCVYLLVIIISHMSKFNFSCKTRNLIKCIRTESIKLYTNLSWTCFIMLIKRLIHQYFNT